MTAPRWIFIVLAIWLSGCAGPPSVATRIQTADSMATQAGWVAEDISTAGFVLRAYRPRALPRADTLTIYIEGDGLAWLDRSTPSLNPTPVDPLALRLALRDPGPAVYLGRPCQYLTRARQSNCRMRYWTGDRFAPEVIEATSAAIDQLRLRFAANKVVLIGYSGGGAVATLASVGRDDVAELITVAGNLDHRRWTRAQRLSPLSGSLNPADCRHRLAHLRQTHLVGERDTTITPDIARDFVAQAQWVIEPRVVVVPGFDHRCCWDAVWPITDRSRDTDSGRQPGQGPAIPVAPR